MKWLWHPAKSIHTMKKPFTSAEDNVPYYELSDSYQWEISWEILFPPKTNRSSVPHRSLISDIIIWSSKTKCQQLKWFGHGFLQLVPSKMSWGIQQHINTCNCYVATSAQYKGLWVLQNITRQVSENLKIVSFVFSTLLKPQWFPAEKTTTCEPLVSYYKHSSTIKTLLF